MISEEITKTWYDSLPPEQKLKLALFNDFGDEAKSIYGWLQENKNILPPPTADIRRADGVYYIYEDGTSELFDYERANSPSKKVKRIGVVMGSHSLAVNLEDLPESALINTDDESDYSGYIDNRTDAVADWNGKPNTEHIKSVGTDIKLADDEWLPSVAELYLLYLNKRSINKAIVLSGGSRIKDGWYWSSTEYSAQDAWIVYFIDGCLYTSIRAIALTAARWQHFINP